MKMMRPAPPIMNDYDNQEQQVFESDFRALISLFRYGRTSYRKLAFSLVLILAASSAAMMSAKCLGLLAESLTKVGDGRNLGLLVSLILVLELGNVVLTYWGRISLARTTNRISLNIRHELFRKVTRLPIAYYDRNPLGRTLTRLTSDVDGVETFFAGSLSKVLAAGISIATVLIAMMVTNPQFGAAVVISSTPALLMTFVTRAPIRRWLRAYKARSAEVNSRLAEYVAGITVIKVFGLEEWTLMQFKKSSAQLLEAGLMMTNWNSFIRPTAALFCSVPLVVIFWLGGHQALAGTWSVGLVVSFVRYSERFFWPVMAVTQEIHVIQEALASSERIRQMLDEPDEAEVLGADGRFAAPLLGEVHFRDVWMGYNPRMPVLRGITFQASPGMKVGLVGATGSGKSTTVNLVPALYPLLNGTIEIDGLPLSQWDRRTIRRQLGVVSQDVIIFGGTLRENLLAVAKQSHGLNDEALLKMLDRTGFLRIMSRFDKGLDTMLVDGGENLSMGERQVIAFTRMFIRDPRVMILDEATANIDEECEQVLHDALHELMRGRTCFVIAHRLSTVRLMDQILVFDHGTIIDQGTHDELVSREGIYQALSAAYEG